MAAETEATARGAGSRRVDVAAAQRGTVLRLLRGEDLGAVSRSLGVMAAALTAWRDTSWLLVRRAWRPAPLMVGRWKASGSRPGSARCS